jgi:hypothetical protein
MQQQGILFNLPSRLCGGKRSLCFQYHNDVPDQQYAINPHLLPRNRELQ